jgi:hypothetical protein
MKITRFLFPVLWSASASAQVFVDPVEDMMDSGPSTVFVSPFQPQNADSAGIAGMMSSFLEAELSRFPDLSVIPVDAVPAVHDTSATVYLESCPPGQQVGCAFVVGEGAGAEFALTGTVQSDATGTQVEVSIIDVRASREAMSFVATIGVGEDARFTEGVAAVLIAVVRGEAGRVEDIRDLSVTAATDYSAAAAQLAQLSAELGDIEAHNARSGAVIVPPVITAEEISDRMEREGVKPWERVGLGPDEYLRWKNSGEDLVAWRERHNGRKGKLVLRGGFGFVRGPVNGLYRGIYAQELLTEEDAIAGNGGDQLIVREAYAWQSLEAGSGFVTEVAAGYGITREIEVGLQFGYASGQYRTQVDAIVVGNGIVNDTGDSPELSYTNGNLFVGPYVLSVFMPERRFRPLVGGGVLYWKGSTVDSKEDVGSELDTFNTPTVWMIQLKGGVELQLSKMVDLYAHVPITIGLGGGSMDTFHEGEYSDPDTNAPAIRTGKDKPPGASPIGGGLLVGLQFKLFGPKFK